VLPSAAGGVAIESTVGRFKQALKREVRPEQYAFGIVKYHVDMSKAKEIRHNFTAGSVPASGNLWRLALQVGFNKRTFYQDENEWRAAIFQEQLRPRVLGLSLTADLDVLIQTVRIGPTVDQPTVTAVKELMRSTSLEMSLEESSILKRPHVRRSR
jgi:hypothetical protein